MSEGARVWSIAAGMARDSLARPPFVTLGLILYLTVPLQMGFLDGLASRSGMRPAGLVDLSSSFLMQGCGPALVIGIAATGLRFGGRARPEFRMAFILFSGGLYLLYIPVGFALATCSYRAAAGTFPPHLLTQLMVFALAALVSAVCVGGASVRALLKAGSPSYMAVRVALGYLPLAALDLLRILLRLWR